MDIFYIGLVLWFITLLVIEGGIRKNTKQNERIIELLEEIKNK
ncbi:hypothetical protein [Ectobacillus panaciterrae]|nr:hypothetical protein [Ectobacillus panaciterrae]